MFPSGFVFGMVTPLHLIHLDLASTGKMDVFFKNADGSLLIGARVLFPHTDFWHANRAKLVMCQSFIPSY
jgi:hypothetical protein